MPQVLGFGPTSISGAPSAAERRSLLNPVHAKDSLAFIVQELVTR